MRTKRNIIRFIIALIFILSINNVKVMAVDKVNENTQGLEINKTNIVIQKNKSTTIKIKNNGSDVNNINIDTTWNAINKKIATVNKKNNTTATIKAVNAGITTIKAQVADKTLQCKVTVMAPAEKEGYYYTVVNGYRIYYVKNGNSYKRLDGRTNYSSGAAGKNDKMYAGTNEILKAIGYENKYDFRVLIAIEPKYANCTLTVLAKDENGKYTIPVRSSLCMVPEESVLNKNKNLNPISLNGEKDLKTLKGTLRTVDKRSNRVSGWKKFKSSGTKYSPGTMSTEDGLYQSLKYDINTGSVKKGEYTNMGTASTFAGIRLYWQDLKWLYENCEPQTYGVMLRTTKTFIPFGSCTKIGIRSNKTQENPQYSVVKKYQYFYKIEDGFKIYYSKEANGTERKLDGRTNYSEKAAGNANKMYTGTNEILKVIGYENKYDFRMIIAVDPSMNNNTLTVLAKDDEGNYTIPVRSSLCAIPGDGDKSFNNWLNKHKDTAQIELNGNINIAKLRKYKICKSYD